MNAEPCLPKYKYLLVASQKDYHQLRSLVRTQPTLDAMRGKRIVKFSDLERGIFVDSISSYSLSVKDLHIESEIDNRWYLTALPETG